MIIFYQSLKRFFQKVRKVWGEITSSDGSFSLWNREGRDESSGSTSKTTATTTQLPNVTPGQMITSTPNLIKENSQHSSKKT